MSLYSNIHSETYSASNIKVAVYANQIGTHFKIKLFRVYVKKRKCKKLTYYFTLTCHGSVESTL